MKVLILLQGRFPTEKAYGVTTTGTVEALFRLGYQVTVFSVGISKSELDSKDIHFKLKHYSETKFSKTTKLIAFSGTGLINKIFWSIFWKLTYRHNKSAILAECADIFWIRDYTMLHFVPKKKAIIFELHGLIDKSKKVKLKFKAEDEIVVFAPISRTIENQLSFLKSKVKIVRAPMGIESEFLETKEGIQKYLQRIEVLQNDVLKGLKIGYIGKFSPNGYSKGIEDLLELAKFNLKEQLEYEISITGGTDNELIMATNKLLEYGLTENDVKISGHIPHRAVFDKMKELEVIVLPMPASRRYVGFPLKSIESVASGRIVIAARCRIYEDIFNQSFEPYWYESGSAISMNNAIKEAFRDESLEDRLGKGIEFSSRFTWDARTKTLLDALKSSQYNSIT
jgi:glycosyltransferase involved in cell wall biosynthesis